MSYKVAVASSDGKVINQHFGRSRQFLIFEVDGEEWSFLELRENTPPCGSGEHHEDDMARSIELLSDCKRVLVSRIGTGAEEQLNVHGISVHTMSDFIDHALKKLIGYEKCQSY